jgi:(1->4)-alpha-D-glucan 1-alpha-D-glucosylmutase
MTMPGIPDIYQGSEFWDLSLVDPDNRRPVDFATRLAALPLIQNPDWPALAASWPDGRIKFALTFHLLALRRENSALFTHGSFLPLEVAGADREEVIAFARIRGRDAVVVVVGRLFGRASDGGRHWPNGQAWDASLAMQNFTEVRSILGAHDEAAGTHVAGLFDAMPVAVLRAKYAQRSRFPSP